MLAGIVFSIFCSGDGGFGVVTNDAKGGDTSNLGIVCAAVVKTINGEGGVGMSHVSGSKSHASYEASSWTGSTSGVVGEMTIGSIRCWLWLDWRI